MRTFLSLLIAATVALAFDGLIDGHLHGASCSGQLEAVSVEAVVQGDGPLLVATLPTAMAFLSKVSIVSICLSKLVLRK